MVDNTVLAAYYLLHNKVCKDSEVIKDKNDDCFVGTDYIKKCAKMMIVSIPSTLLNRRRR